MKLHLSEPEPSGDARRVASAEVRKRAAESAAHRPQALTRANGEEFDHANDSSGVSPTYPASFTKGLAHDACGLLQESQDYACFVEAINSSDTTLFEKHVETAETRDVAFHCRKKTVCGEEKDVTWRGWESPRSGHVYDLQGPDSGAVGMAPAPRVGSSELAAEMAEVYALAILRDVPFETIRSGGGTRLCDDGDGGDAKLTADKVVKALNGMPYFSGKKVVSSTPGQHDCDGYNRFERNRRAARTGCLSQELTTESVFRGSTRGAMEGPYISQFMLIGADSLACRGDACEGHPCDAAEFGLESGLIPYGSLVIDQRSLAHKSCLDYMTDWASWLDVQNGANFKGADRFESRRRFITTPRDLATYVHFDALYEAYLNAAIILWKMGAKSSKGFPEPSPSLRRDAFATFGGPHVLTLVTEVATRCLKAVRRQKFNYHRRARPEALGGRLSLVALEATGKLGCAAGAFEDTYNEIPVEIRDAIIAHNREQNDKDPAMRNIKCEDLFPPCAEEDSFDAGNLLLPMAFPEGSPMHPSYGAGHATVAGGCVTMVKAFFEMFTDCHGGIERPLVDGKGNAIAFVPNGDGTALEPDTNTCDPLTIQGELDKLAANISIGRNMAGVHYYSDYYDSARMGERVAVGMLLEQMPTYGEEVVTTFRSFDGDMITLSGEAHQNAAMTILDCAGNPVDPRDWWLRHVPGESLIG